jgi:hypothetical protein
LDRRLHIGEQGNQRISVLDPQGNFIRVWGVAGTALKQFNNISDMRFDANGLLWVLDSGNNRIQIFDKYGDYLETISGSGITSGQFSNPQGMAFGLNNEIYVADTGSNRIQKFTICSNGPTATPTATATPVSPTIYDLKVDVGSTSSYTDPSGNLWLSDQAFTSGNFGYTQSGTAASTTSTVIGTQEQPLYQTYRMGSNLAYKATLPPGNYYVTLKFSDFISTAAGQNVFNVLAQGQTQLNGVDVFAAAGHSTALDLHFQVTVSAGQCLTLQLSAVTGRAMVSAIEVTALQNDVNPLLFYFENPGGEALIPQGGTDE